ncbi:MAG: hypothetical protein ABR879_05745 [Methanomassiliicoccales archaeon]|jgi:hypothetical protein
MNLYPSMRHGTFLAAFGDEIGAVLRGIERLSKEGRTNIELAPQ